jgi:hypothetical protein
VLARLLRVPTIRVVHVFALGVMAWTASISPERDDAFVCQHILQVFNGLQEIQSSASSCRFICVLIVSSQVINSAFSR